MDKEIRNYQSPVEIRSNEDGPAKVVGYAAVFNRESEILWGFREKVAPNAFDEADMRDVRALFNHDANLLLARTPNTLTLSVDEKGLRYEFEIPNTSIGRDLHELMLRGDITQSSFGFTIAEDSWEEREGDIPMRTITKIERLYDVSPVTYPAYPDAEAGLVSKRSYEEWKKENRSDPEPTPEPPQNDTPLLDRVGEFLKLKNVKL